MSSSWRSSARRPAAGRAGAGPAGSAVTVIWPSGQYQAGIRWPHHSWRLTFQSRISVSQCSQTASKRSGTIRVWPAPGGGQGAFGQRLRADEPLGLQARLDDVVAALAAADQHLVGHRRDEVAARVQVGQDPPARLGQGQPGVAVAVLVDPPGVVEDVDHRQVVAAARRVVVRIVGRRDLDRPGAELGPDDVVGDDRHEAARRTGSGPVAPTSPA